MKRCESCKYWSELLKSAPLGICKSEKFVYYSLDCPKELKTDDRLEYGDYEGYGASFATGPKFGCVHHSG